MVRLIPSSTKVARAPVRTLVSISLLDVRRRRSGGTLADEERAEHEGDQRVDRHESDRKLVRIEEKDEQRGEGEHEPDEVVGVPVVPGLGANGHDDLGRRDRLDLAYRRGDVGPGGRIGEPGVGHRNG